MKLKLNDRHIIIVLQPFSTILFLSLLLISCQSYRNCNPSVDNFGIRDRKKLEQKGLKIIHQYLPNTCKKMNIQFSSSFSSYEVTSLDLFTDKMFQRNFRPKLKTTIYDFHLSYTVAMNECIIGTLLLPLNNQYELDPNRSKRFLERTAQLEEFVQNNYYHNFSEIVGIAQNHGFIISNFVGVYLINSELKWIFYDYGEQKGISIDCKTASSNSSLNKIQFHKISSQLYQ
jgi:hypothetical protein